MDPAGFMYPENLSPYLDPSFPAIIPGPGAFPQYQFPSLIFPPPLTYSPHTAPFFPGSEFAGPLPHLNLAGPHHLGLQGHGLPGHHLNFPQGLTSQKMESFKGTKKGQAFQAYWSQKGAKAAAAAWEAYGAKAGFRGKPEAKQVAYNSGQSSKSAHSAQYAGGKGASAYQSQSSGSNTSQGGKRSSPEAYRSDWNAAAGIGAQGQWGGKGIGWNSQYWSGAGAGKGWNPWSQYWSGWKPSKGQMEYSNEWRQKSRSVASPSKQESIFAGLKNPPTTMTAEELYTSVVEKHSIPLPPFLSTGVVQKALQWYDNNRGLGICALAEQVYVLQQKEIQGLKPSEDTCEAGGDKGEGNPSKPLRESKY